MISAQPKTTDGLIVAPASMMYSNAQCQVVKLEVPGVRADSIVVVTEEDELVMTGERNDGCYYRRIPLQYHARRECIKTRLLGDTLEIWIPNPEAASA
jgi:HSP20 family molecular chaperone IbpA